MKAGLRPLGLEPATEDPGGDPVELRGLVQPDEGVGREPVPARTFTSIDERDPDVAAVVGERVGEGHAHGPGTDDQVVDVQDARHVDTKPAGT